MAEAHESGERTAHVTLRSATEADVKEIARLQRENQKELIPDEEWQQMVEENGTWDANEGLSWTQHAEGLAAVIDYDRTIVVQTDDGEIVGYLFTTSFDKSTPIRYSQSTRDKINRVIGEQSSKFNIDTEEFMCCGQILILEKYQGTRLTSSGHLIPKEEAANEDQKLMHAMYERFDDNNARHETPYDSRIADVAGGTKQNGKSLNAHMSLPVTGRFSYNVLKAIENTGTDGETYQDNVLWRRLPKTPQIYT